MAAAVETTAEAADITAAGVAAETTMVTAAAVSETAAGATGIPAAAVAETAVTTAMAETAVAETVATVVALYSAFSRAGLSHTSLKWSSSNRCSRVIFRSISFNLELAQIN